VDINAITVCVNYDDYLKHCLPRNRAHFKNYYVVTDSENEKIIKPLCLENNASIIITDSFYDDKALFNKGKAINAILKKLVDSWICILDADMILPPNFLRILKKRNLQKDTIYGCKRIFCPSPEAFFKYLKIPRLIKRWKIDGNYGMTAGKEYAPGGVAKRDIPYLPLGFFQLFHSSQKHLYPEDVPHAAKSDMDFPALWDKQKFINISAIHLPVTEGESWENYYGRSTPPFPASI
jgi:hypothetical protein